MTTSAEQIRAYKGPAILGFGFRPFFLFAAIWSALAMVLWITAFTGNIMLPGAFSMVDWHVHEFLYGYLSAVMAGFLLTAVPNWTGRLPITGYPLLGLFLLWLAGRIALLVPQYFGALPAAFIDLSFLAVFAFVIGREVLAGRNWRNLKVLILLSLFFAGNVTFHIEAAQTGIAFAGYGTRLGTAVAVFLIMLIGGRIVPSFTRNWLARRPAGQMPADFGRFDTISLSASGLALLSWIFYPGAQTSAFLLLIAGVLQSARLVRWAGWRTLAEPLVLILHIGFGFVPLGFLVMGAAILHPDILLPSAALHAWTAGAIGTMTLAVMTRASLGHSGRALHAGPGTVLIYILAIAAVLVRMAWGLGFASENLLHISAACWILAYAGFGLLYAPLLVRPRKKT